jgi:putative glutamine amidotransferase
VWRRSRRTREVRTDGRTIGPVQPMSSGDLAPRIGLSTYRERAAWGVWDVSADLLPASYSDAIDQAGGVPMLLPPTNRSGPTTDLTARADAALAGLDGLLLSGGPDVDPARYGALRQEHTGPARPERDSWEIALAVSAINRGVPVLGVCRGMQTLNVALGGTLIQHLPDVLGHEGHCAVIGVHGHHDVRTAAGSRIEAIQGPRIEVATYHHQGVGELGSDLVATAWTDDGLVEAVELAGPAWVLGVQWHPEMHNGAALFGDFVRACASWARKPSREQSGV